MVPTNGGLYNTESKNLIFWHLDFLNAGSWGNLSGPGVQKSQCSKMAMRMGLVLVDQVACQVGGLNLGGLEFLGVDGKRVLVQDY